MVIPVPPPPWLYIPLLATTVGLGLPAGALVVGGGGGCIARCGRADRIAARQTATRQTLEDEGCVWSGLLTKLPSPSSAIVPGESFGSDAVIRALQALRRGHSHLDPRLQEKLQQHRCRRTGREPQTLMGLARGWSNWKIAAGMASHRPRCATA